MAVWSQFYGTYRSIWSNRYVDATGWGTAELIQTDDTGHALYPQVAVDVSSNAVVVWYHAGTEYDIYSNWYMAGTGWGTEEAIDTDLGTAVDPQVAVDSGGNAVAVWQQHTTYYDTWANRYVSGTGWGNPPVRKRKRSGRQR